MTEETAKHGLGPKGFCKCPKCEYKVEHEAGKPCRELKCPKCDVTLIREGSQRINEPCRRC